jgi:hypothetical protein
LTFFFFKPVLQTYQSHSRACNPLPSSPSCIFGGPNTLASSVSKSNVHSSISNALFVPMWASLCHHHCLCLQVHFALYPLLLAFWIFFYFALWFRRWRWVVICCHLPLHFALVQKTMMSSCVARLGLLCVTKSVLICNTLIMLTLNILNFFVLFFCKLNSKPTSYASKGSSSNARWTWRWNGIEWMGSWRINRVLQGECMH